MTAAPSTTPSPPVFAWAPVARSRLSATSRMSRSTDSRAFATASVCSLRERFFQFSKSAAMRSMRSRISSRSISSAAARSSGVAGGSSAPALTALAVSAVLFSSMFDSSLISVGSRFLS